jgi:Ca-activated chloride channel family protein
VVQGRTGIQFGDPIYLWLLLVPGLLLLIWSLQAARRRRDVLWFLRRRVVPVRERWALFGDLLSWLCLLVALTLTVLALARPRAPVTAVNKAGVDLVVLQDGSASMHVRDVKPDRWQRSMVFLRRLAETLRWTDDRIALTLFAHIAAPQVRLTRDPNTLFFFLDHLARESPFPLEDDTTWDTNMEAGLHWGLRLMEKDEELHGRSPNTKAFVLVSDGQAWSGQIERALQTARSRDIPVFVVGVGTAAGGYIPEGSAVPNAPPATSRVFSTLDRPSLGGIASAGGGRYFELDRESDRAIAGTIIEAARRRAGLRAIEQGFTEFYWQCLLAAAFFICLAIPSSRDPVELWLHAIGAGAALLILWTALR